MGVKEGDRVGIFPVHTFEMPLIFFALFRLKAIACPLSTYIPFDSFAEKLDELGSTFFLFPNGTPLPKIKQISIPFSNLLRKTHSFYPSQDFLDKTSHATYLFTSGSSRDPKIACLSLSNHYYSALGSNAYFSLKETDRWLLSLPLYHTAGIAILFRCFLKGATVVLQENKHLDFKEIPIKKVTHLSFIPTQLYRLLSQDDQTIKSIAKQVKHILLGGAFTPLHLYKRALNKGLSLYPTYGMTEMSSQITTVQTPSNSSFSLGQPLPYRELKISKDKEILVKGKTLFKGYFQFNHSPLLSLDNEGWFATGDLANYCPRKGLKIIGRKDRLFISGGENIHPEEIEHVLSTIQDILDVHVLPIKDKEFGYKPIAYIKMETKLNQEELKEKLAAFLPKFKIPIAFFPMDGALRPKTFKSKNSSKLL